MRIEIDKFGNRNEYSDEGKWLYQDRGENDRYFTTIVLLGNAEPAWAECLDIEKVTWNMDFSKDIDLSSWNPTTALANNLQQFLLNFREFIAERLAKYTGAASGKPLLTLSPAVRNAIEADGIASFIKNDRNWEISPEPNNQ